MKKLREINAHVFISPYGVQTNTTQSCFLALRHLCAFLFNRISCDALFPSLTKKTSLKVEMTFDLRERR